MGRLVRIGIDVGGTFTKAVLLDNDSHEIIGQVVVPTTHGAEAGVAEGVIDAFRRALGAAGITAADDVVFIAHSTTQATNALLEGDVARVGVIGMGRGAVESRLARSQTVIGDIELAAGRVIASTHTFMRSDEAGADAVRAAVAAVRAQGARVVVASDAFSVDDARAEEQVMAAAAEAGLPATGGHEISKLYGLTIRTRTAVINASILPKMIETAQLTHEAVRQAGITAPLMIMRGDGGVMDLGEVQKRPVLTMLSGPAASVAGALMYLRVSDGIFFEVGGTSTNIGVIRGGQPTIAFAQVGGHRTYISSLDVRVLGIAGGSMVRLEGDRIVDVGPRSAHIAGLPYAAFQPAASIVDPAVELIQPKADDPAGYVAIRLGDGRRVALTTTDAANVLGLVKAGDYSHGDPEAARRAMAPLAARMGLSVEDTARTLCTPDGIPRLLESPYPFEVIQTRGQVTMVYEMNHAIRLVDMTKPLESDETLSILPYYDGHSAGHWEGDTLVIQTAGFNEKTFIDATGAPHSDEMHVTERLRRINGGKQLEDIATVQDPKNYTKPWSARFVYDFHPELRLEAYVCGESHRDLSKVKGVRGF